MVVNHPHGLHDSLVPQKLLYFPLTVIGYLPGIEPEPMGIFFSFSLLMIIGGQV